MCMMYDMGINCEVSIVRFVKLKIIGSKIRLGMVWVNISMEMVIIYDINESMLVIFMFCLGVIIIMLVRKVICVIVLILVMDSFNCLFGLFWCMNLLISIVVVNV